MSILQSISDEYRQERITVLRDRAKTIGRVCAALLAIIPILVLAGWQLDIAVLKSIKPGYIEMNPLTAVLFLLTSAAVLLHHTPADHPARKVVAIVLSLLVTGIAFIKLQGFLSGWDAGVDRFLYESELNGNVMAPNTALSFTLIGLAMLLQFATHRRITAVSAQTLVLLAVLLAMTALLGYAYGAQPLFKVGPFVPMAVHTAICFLLSAGAILSLRPDVGLMSLLTRPGPSGALFRRSLPAALLLPAVIGWFRVIGQRKNWYEMEIGVALFSVLVMLAFGVLAWLNAKLLHRTDLQRVAAERELATERNLLRSLIDNLPDHIYIKDASGRYITDNRAHARFVGLAGPEEIAGKSLNDFFPPELAEKFAADDQEVIRSGVPLIAREEPIINRRGERMWLATTKAPIIDADGHTTGLVCISRDITVRKKAESDMLELQNFLSSIIENIPNMVFVKDAEQLRFVRFNRAGEELLGASRADLLGKNDYDLFPKEQADFFTAKDRSVLNSGKLADIETESIDTARGRRMLHTKKIPIIADGKPRYLLGISEDITEHLQFEQQLKVSERHTREIVDTANDAFVEIDRDGIIIAWNHASETLFGWSRTEAIGRPLGETIIPQQYREGHRAGVQRYFDTGQGPLLNKRFEITALRRDGTEFPIELTISPLVSDDQVTFASFIHDITNRKAAEKLLVAQYAKVQEMAQSEREAHDALKKAQGQMLQTEKLAAMGQLVAGVAHEINNPLSFVSNNVAVLQRDVAAIKSLLDLYRRADQAIEQCDAKLNAEIRDLSERVDIAYTLGNLDEMMVRSRDGLKRIQQIVKDLRDFARLDEADLQDADLNHGVDSTVNIIRGRAKSRRVQLELDLNPLPLITCYPAKINQVVMNLVANAIDASHENGTVTVRSTALPDNSGAKIEVIDQGTGIPPAVREKIFDPFFTTKKQGEGTGLGLSISYGIIRDHKGTITIDSEEGKGSTFTITLPAGALKST
jgi:two-component system NtrC family sensor kinase